MYHTEWIPGPGTQATSKPKSCTKALTPVLCCFQNVFFLDLEVEPPSSCLPRPFFLQSLESPLQGGALGTGGQGAWMQLLTQIAQFLGNELLSLSLQKEILNLGPGRGSRLLVGVMHDYTAPSRVCAQWFAPELIKSQSALIARCLRSRPAQIPNTWHEFQSRVWSVIDDALISHCVIIKSVENTLVQAEKPHTPDPKLLSKSVFSLCGVRALGLSPGSALQYDNGQVTMFEGITGADPRLRVCPVGNHCCEAVLDPPLGQSIKYRN